MKFEAMIFIGISIGVGIFALSCLFTKKTLSENFLTWQDKQTLKRQELIVSIILGLYAFGFSIGIYFFCQIKLDNGIWAFLVLYIIFTIILAGITVLIYLNQVSKLLRDCKKTAFVTGLYYLIKQEIDSKNIEESQNKNIKKDKK